MAPANGPGLLPAEGVKECQGGRCVGFGDWPGFGFQSLAQCDPEQCLLLLPCLRASIYSSVNRARACLGPCGLPQHRRGICKSLWVSVPAPSAIPVIPGPPNPEAEPIGACVPPQMQMSLERLPHGSVFVSPSDSKSHHTLGHSSTGGLAVRHQQGLHGEESGWAGPAGGREAGKIGCRVTGRGGKDLGG